MVEVIADSDLAMELDGLISRCDAGGSKMNRLGEQTHSKRTTGAEALKCTFVRALG